LAWIWESAEYQPRADRFRACAAVEDDERQIEDTAGGHGDAFGLGQPHEALLFDRSPEQVRRLERGHVLNAESKAVADRAEIVSVGSPAHQQAGQIAEADFAFEVDFAQAVAMDPKG
jgi:hypothetical protein